MHLEPTSRCTLFCPACPRTWFADKFNRPFPKQDLDLDDLVKFLDCEKGREVDHFLINGNHGDPIYYPNLLELIDTFRSTKYYKISTNGSHQTVKFWEQLAQRLTDQDTIYFSIDGLEHNNHLYRRNADWKSIMTGLDIMLKSPAKVVWKTLIFSYNEKEIEQIKDVAESKGAVFVSEPSSRFGEDTLRPKNEQLVDVSRFYQNNLSVDKLEPQCLSQHYVSADGYYWPCCLITSVFTLHKTALWKQRNDWAIKNQTLDGLRSKLEHWRQDIIEHPNDAHAVCKMNCKPGQKFAWAST